MRFLPLAALVLGAVRLLGADDPAPAFKVANSVILTSPADHYFTQSRGALVAVSPPRVIVTTQTMDKAGTHGYRDLYSIETTDGGQTWTAPAAIESLRRKTTPGGDDFLIGDVWPQWHAATRTILATGKTFGFREGKTEDHSKERVSYSVYAPATGQWSGLNLLQLPNTDHEGAPMIEANAGCHQRYDLPDGDILLPIRYRKDPKNPQYTTIVARCGFDGRTLNYRQHGSELTIPRDRGLYEPSLTCFRDRYFLTLRANHAAFVSRSRDGLNYEPPVEWTFDDGKPLGSDNTQQHWVTHSDALYLVYTRRGANNDQVFRHRAPLFIARVDPERRCLIRASEQVLMPEKGLDLGNFGVVDVSPQETWVITSEMSYPKGRQSEPNHVLLAKIQWAQANALFRPTVPPPATP